MSKALILARVGVKPIGEIFDLPFIENKVSYFTLKRDYL
jgi:hypothetical protein